MSPRVPITLTDEQRTALEQMTRSGAGPARTLTKARALLLADRGRGGRRSDRAVAEATGLHPITVGRLPRRFAADGPEAARRGRARPGAVPKVTGEVEAHLVTLARSDPPPGQKRWTLRLPAGRMVGLGHVQSRSHVTVGERLNKTRSSLGR